ncbi:hypothetical protein PSEUDO8Z_120018 [Pseudomonas sp. 8Z]|nr:hypothetical protein PSEUDO8Z_120018 [Pseudomonas sp. 8Z]
MAAVLLIGQGNATTFLQALAGAQLEFPADQRAHLVDGAAHAVAVQCSAPVVVQATHHLATPLVGVDKALGDAGLAKEHHFQLAAASCTGAATDFGMIWQLGMGDGLAHGAAVYAMQSVRGVWVGMPVL